MRTKLFFVFALVAATLLAACNGVKDAPAATSTPIPMVVVQPTEAPPTAAPTAEPTAVPPTAAPTSVSVVPTAEPAPTDSSSSLLTTVVINALVNPELHHADSHAPEEGPGSFDIGVNGGQIGIVFGWHLSWSKGSLDAGGEGCDLVVLTPGWYENLQIVDARYEVYDIPSSDYPGWVEALVVSPDQGRLAEQARHYGCPSTPDHIQVWADNGTMVTWSVWIE